MIWKASILLPLVLILAVGCGGGATETAETTNTSDAEEMAPMPEGPIRHEIAVGTLGFDPPVVQARAGEEVTLVFTRITEETCGTEVVLEAHGIDEMLPLNEPVEVTFTPAESGTLEYGCGMDKMLVGKVVVN